LTSSLKNNKNEYQQCISSITNVDFMKVSSFERVRFKNAEGAGSKQRPISKKFWISQYFGLRQKVITQAS